MDSNVIGEGKMPKTIIYGTSSGVLSLQVGVTPEMLSPFVGGEEAVNVRFLDADGKQSNMPIAFQKGIGSDAYNIQGMHYIIDTNTLCVYESIKATSAPWNLFGVLLNVNGKLRRVESWLDIVKAQPENYRELEPTYTHNLGDDRYVSFLETDWSYKHEAEEAFSMLLRDL